MGVGPDSPHCSRTAQDYIHLKFQSNNIISWKNVHSKCASFTEICYCLISGPVEGCSAFTWSGNQVAYILCGAVGGRERSSLTSDFSADTVDVFTVCAVVCSRHRKRTSSSVWHRLTFHPHRNTIFQNKSFTSIPVFDVTPLIECVLWHRAALLFWLLLTLPCAVSAL